MTMKGCLNIDQSPEELSRIYQDDYYWYLDSVEFHRAFLRPLGEKISEVATRVLDVGCGVGQLSDHVKIVGGVYVGIEGSREAVERAWQKRPSVTVVHGRIEYPRFGWGSFDTIVFGGLLAVLIKPEEWLLFIGSYLKSFSASQFFVYDMESLDTTELDRNFEKVWEYHAAVDLPGLQEVKRRRKIILYRVKQ